MIDPCLVIALKILALKNAHKEFVEINTTKLGNELGISQQSASRRLKILNEQGFIEEKRIGKKIYVKITRKGLDLLKKEAVDYRKIFDIGKYITINGEVVSGIGEGKYYITKKGYYDQIKEKLYFEPFPGTLNVRVYARDMDKVDLIKNSNGILIRGFESEGRTFGNVKAFLCTINGVDGAVIIPDRSHYTDVIEVIADVNLREKLHLSDGTPVEIVIYI